MPFDPEIRTILDVGASSGQFALLAMQRFPDARILCFEPLPQAQESLGAVTRGRAEIHAVALGREPGEAEFVVSALDDSSSLLPMAQRHIDEYPGTKPERTMTVRVATLSDYLTDELPGPRLLKLDVQGNELDVLRGAGDRLDLIDEVFVECSFVELYIGQAYADDVVCFLRDAGLRLIGIHGVSTSADNTTLQADLHFRRGSRVCRKRSGIQHTRALDRANAALSLLGELDQTLTLAGAP